VLAAEARFRAQNKAKKGVPIGCPDGKED